jgi:hypothetical protein
MCLFKNKNIYYFNIFLKLCLFLLFKNIFEKIKFFLFFLFVLN